MQQQTLEQRIAACPKLRRAQLEGLDLHLLWDNLQRPVSEQIRRHQSALDTINKLCQIRNPWLSFSHIIGIDTVPDEVQINAGGNVEVPA